MEYAKHVMVNVGVVENGVVNGLNVIVIAILYIPALPSKQLRRSWDD